MLYLYLCHHLSVFILHMLQSFQHRLKMNNTQIESRKSRSGASVFCCEMIMAIVLNFGIIVPEGFLSLTVANKTQILHYF